MEASSRRPLSWTDRNIDKLKKVRSILDELHEFKPLTLRQIYYQLVGKQYIGNTKSEYTSLSKLLKQARLDNLIAWDDMEDRVRAYYDLTGWGDSNNYIQQSLKSFLNTYRRDLMQTQDVYIEIWIEKDALSSVFTKVAEKYTIPVVSCRGFSSVTFLNNYKSRLRNKLDKRHIILYFGDFDPSGMEMMNSMEITLRDELNMNNVELKRIALLPSDISVYRLPNKPEALKVTDTRSKKFVQKYGYVAVELDALSPSILQNIIERSIQAEIDLGLLNNELKKEENECYKLDRIKDNVRILIEEIDL